MGTLHRAQVLLETEQHEALVEIAAQEGRSISDVVREIVREHLAERSEQAQQTNALKAIEWLTQVRDALQEEHGVLTADLLAEARAEWEEDVERVWRGDR